MAAQVAFSLARSLPMVFRLLQMGLDAKNILDQYSDKEPQVGSKLSKLQNLGYSPETILKQLIDKSSRTTPQMFTTDFGNYLNEMEKRSEKDHNRFIKGIAVAGATAKGLQTLYKKYGRFQLPETKDFESTEKPQEPILSDQQQQMQPEATQRQPVGKETQQQSFVRPEEPLEQPTESILKPTEPTTQIDLNKPIIFDTKLHQTNPIFGETLDKLAKQGFSKKQIESIAVRAFGRLAARFENETERSIGQEIEALIANKDQPTPLRKPKQLVSSEDDKKMQDAGVKPILKPIRQKNKIDASMLDMLTQAPQQKQQSLPNQKQAFMANMMELQRLLKGM